MTDVQSIVEAINNLNHIILSFIALYLFFTAVMMIMIAALVDHFIYKK